MLGLRFALGWVHAATGQRGQAGCRGRGCVPHSPGWGLPPVLHEAGEALAGGTVTFPSGACGLSRGGEKSPAASRPRQAEHCAALRCSPKDTINSPTALPCLLLPQLSRQPLPSLHPASPGAFRMPLYAVY